MKEFNANDLKTLRDMTGSSFASCRQALEKCSSIEIAREYLRVKSQPMVRCKVDRDGNKRPYNDEDYIELAEAYVKRDQKG